MKHRARLARRWCRKLLGPLREIAWDHGYALCVHGTIRRDIDLVAVPWIEWATSAEALIEAFAEEIARYVDPRVAEYDATRLAYRRRQPGLDRPHGRRCEVFHLSYKFGDAPYIDLSVMRPTRTNVE